MAPCFSGSKRSLAMVVCDPAAANKRARQDEATTSSSPNAGALFPHAASVPPPFGDFEPINAVPLSTAPPLLPPLQPLPAVAREEPPCLRKHFLVALGLRADLPVHFIDEKLVTSTDLDAHQNRFRLPSDGVMRRLRAILTPTELHSTNLLHDPVPKPRPPKQQPEEPQNGAAAAEGKKIKKPKNKGKVHGGLRVNLVDLAAGAKKLQLSRWDSSRGTIVKGKGYLDFIRRCSFKERDVVEIWAFLQRGFRLFGANMCDESLLHVLIVKKNQQQPQCRYCAISHQQ